MKILFSIKYVAAGVLLCLLCACSESFADNEPSQARSSPLFRGSLVSSATGQPLHGVRVRALVISGDTYTAPTSNFGTVQTNEQGLFAVPVIQPHLTAMPLELFKERVVKTDTVVISFDGKPVKGAYRWLPGHTSHTVHIIVDPYLSDEISDMIVSEN